MKKRACRRSNTSSRENLIGKSGGGSDDDDDDDDDNNDEVGLWCMAVARRTDLPLRAGLPVNSPEPVCLCV